MIRIIYSVGGEKLEKCFSKTVKGNRESIKFLESLAKERFSHPWYYKLTKIKNIENKLAARKIGTKSKKRYQLESELIREKKDRDEHLEILDIQGPPDLLKIEITSI
jgi:hypothetical protein